MPFPQRVMTKVVITSFVFVLAFVLPGNAQVSCENYGVPDNASSCACPPGFGGPTCSSPACGGDIFQGGQRSLVQSSSATAFGNLTSSGCSCESGWTGTGCNVCQSSTSCQSAFAAAGGNTSSTDSGLGGSTGLNETLTCNTSPKVWAAGEMSCSVIVRICVYIGSRLKASRVTQNPTLQAIYPLSSTLTILRTLNETLTPQPNATSFGVSGTVYAQLWYAGVEQFYCTASSCTQDAPGDGTSSWQCHDLACTCRPNTTFCGAVPLTNLTSTIDGLSGDLDISCGALASQNNTAACSFQQTILNQLFGSQGLSLSGCAFGECVRQGVIDTGAGEGVTQGGGGGKQLSGGVIAGLAVVGVLVAVALLGLLIGWWSRRQVRRGGAGYVKEKRHGGVAVEWKDVSYIVPGTAGKSWLAGLRYRWHAIDRNAGKAVLDRVSGVVEPGQMMGILGPSGASLSWRHSHI